MDEPLTRWVREARSGSDSAAASLFDATWPDALRTARAILGNGAEAEDVAQEAMIRAFKSLRTYDGRGPFTAWLRRIVVNTALNATRGRRPFTELSPKLEMPEVVQPAGGGALAAAVRLLPADRRALIGLRFGLDLTPAEIAELMQLPVGTVKSRIARALDQLRDALEEVHR